MRSDNSGMSRRRLEARVLVAATAVAVLSIGVFASVAFVRNSRGDGNSGGRGKSGDVGPFNVCIAQTRFLVLVRDGYANGVVETIKDQAHGAVVGEVATGPAPTRLGGAAAGDGRYVMSTATPLGRDASAIERCWDRFSQVTRDA